MTSLPFTVDRTVVIRATPEIVFSFFTDATRWAEWWGVGSSIDATPGGRVVIRYPQGNEAVGEVVSVDAPRKLVFTYGYTNGAPIPPGGSRVTIEVHPVAEGTRVSLSHAVAEQELVAKVQGWGFQLTVFANTISMHVHRDAETAVDGWFRAWGETEATSRNQLLRQLAAPDIRFDDQFSMIRGVEELLPHVAMSQQFMPGVGLERAGEARRCRDVLLVDWVAKTTAGEPRGGGTNVFELDAGNRIVGVTGFWKG
jgi:uncharacterized protein YndB with AHSA1/START domain